MTSGLPRKMEQIELLKSNIANYIMQTAGANLSTAAIAFNVGPSTAYLWRKADPEFDRMIEFAYGIRDDVTGDFVESKMFEAINAGSEKLIMFYSRTRMRKRGYIEPQHTPKEPANITLNKTIHFTVVSKPHAKQPELAGANIPPSNSVPETGSGDLPR